MTLLSPSSRSQIHYFGIGIYNQVLEYLKKKEYFRKVFHKKRCFFVFMEIKVGLRIEILVVKFLGLKALLNFFIDNFHYGKLISYFKYQSGFLVGLCISYTTHNLAMTASPTKIVWKFDKVLDNLVKAKRLLVLSIGMTEIVLLPIPLFARNLGMTVNLSLRICNICIYIFISNDFTILNCHVCLN